MKKLLLTLMLLASAGAVAQTAVNQEPLVFDSQEQQERFNRLTGELRCLVCQNQNLADSDAPLAHDLRDEIFEMLQAGRSDEEIKRFLVERYGDFVLYRPPVKGNTLILWLAPAVLLIGGAVVVGANVRRRQRLLEPAGGGEES
jgi:cytochrome c-type biogenesis protein CcmH